MLRLYKILKKCYPQFLFTFIDGRKSMASSKKNKPINIFYAQSGGVTAVINATACGVIQAARENKKIGKVFAGKNGILGGLTEELIDTTFETDEAINSLLYTPGGAFGSCRYKLKSPETDLAEYQRLMDVFKAHDIGYFFYNGGNDSQDTTLKISETSRRLGYPLVCIGIPKTIDNDLPEIDACPGFGSAAKYIAVSIREGAYDVASMAASSTQVFIMEVMGRHHGWLAAAGGLAAEKTGDAPHIILFPEIPFNEAHFLKKVADCVKKFSYCAIVVSEGLRNAKGGLWLESADNVDAFGHHRLGGLGPMISKLITQKLKYRCHHAVCDYLQRSARHIASQTDLEQSYALGSAAVDMAVKGSDAVMMTTKRLSTTPYKWDIRTVALNKVANVEKALPRSFISLDGYSITAACRKYLLPLIQGEAYPPFKNGLPNYARKLKLKLCKKKLKPFKLK
jgi:6-phosphofructokinase